VLLLVDSQLALTEGVLPYLSTKTVVTPGASLTLLLHGHYLIRTHKVIRASMKKQKAQSF
jgi:hypothetical protein